MEEVPMDASQEISIRNKIIGILVKRARLQTGQSQRECAEFLGCSPYMFSQYERGRRGLSLPQLEALAHLFDIAPASLWDERHEPSVVEAARPLPIAQLLLLRRKMLAVKLRQCRQAAEVSQRQVGELLGCSAYIVSQYEQGKRDIPLAELEILAERCGQTLDNFVDQETIPLGQAEQERQALALLNELPPDIRDFVLKPTNALYLRIALLLSSMKADSLRQIAETLLDITY
jgi:transcriptional regulator with XRE-family HTH domain